ncbi:hypothetical protein, partial [Staphylococcus aureus]|uniref:hypothetical protein n=1 Tax=Staphylococcus aureus TaxID=1280 RepID=UPI0030F3DE08
MNPAIGEQWLPFAALKKEISGYALIVDANTARQATSLPLSTESTLPHAMSLEETARTPGIYRLMLLTFFVSLTLFLMPTMVSNAINHAFSSAGSESFPYHWFIASFILSTLMSFGVRVIRELIIKQFAHVNIGKGFSLMLSNTLSFY